MKCYRWAVLILGVTFAAVGLARSGVSARESADPAPLEAAQGGDVDAFDAFLVSVKVKETKANGSSWDPSNGKPDLRVVLSNERSGKTFLSPVAKDTFAVTFSLDHPVLDVAEGDILDILVFDEDLADHDIVGLSRKALTTGLLAKKQLDLTFGQVELLRLEFRPRK